LLKEWISCDIHSAKTLNLLAVAHTYRQQGKNIMLLKPEIDTRFGVDAISSRAGLQQKADLIVKSDTNILKAIQPNLRVNISCFLVDEVQFFEPKHIDQLRTITSVWDIPVICYGLRTDFKTNFFPGSRRLMELADNIEEIKTTCQFCNKKVSWLHNFLSTTFSLETLFSRAGCVQS
jgi:thymidine kinase